MNMKEKFGRGRIRKRRIKKGSAVLPSLSSEQWLILFLVSRFIFDVIGTAIELVFGYFLVCHVVLWMAQFILLVVFWIILIKRPIPLFFLGMLSVFISCCSVFAGHTSSPSEVWIKYTMYQIVFFIPMAIAVYRIKNKGNLLNVYYKIAPFCAVMIIAGLYINRRGITTMGYNQYAGYLLLFVTLIMGTRFFEKRKWTDLLLSVLSCVAILLYCSRGPLLAVLLYAFIMLLMNRDMKLKTKVIAVLTCVFFAFMLILFYSTLLDLAIYFAKQMGVNSRTLYLLKEEPIHWSGRDTILNAVVELIKKNPILGYGAYGWKDIGGYPHNIFFELILAFGIPTGMLLCFMWFLMYVRGFFCLDDNQQRLIFIFGCYCFQLFWSGSFLGDEYFFIFLGLCMAGKSKLKIMPFRPKCNSVSISSEIMSDQKYILNK